jgi:MerR family transcriptional regulator/heat shock protein HspR
MDFTILPRELVAEHLAIAPAVLLRYEAHGLLHAQRAAGVEGYGPVEIRRLWTIVSLQRDLGINLAGVEAIMKLRAQLDDVRRGLAHLADELRDALEADRGAEDET